MPYPDELLKPELIPSGPIDYDQVAAMDPFELSDDLLEIPRLNYRQDTHLLQELLRETVRRGLQSEPSSPEEAAARLRDADFVFASYLGHAVLDKELDPFDFEPSLPAMLVRDGRVAGQQPRDSGKGYSVGNSRNIDPAYATMLGIERTFSGHELERGFIEALRVSVEALQPAEERLAKLVLVENGSEERSSDQELEAVLLQTAEAFTIMGNATIGVMRTMPVDWFNANIAPWFKSLNFGTSESKVIVNGGSGAHFAPGIDYMLWGVDFDTYAKSYGFSAFPEYKMYMSGTLPYEDLHTRTLVRAYAEKNGVSILNHIAMNYDPESPVYLAAKALLEAQRKFRFPHGKVATTALEGREPGKKVGGGGFDGAVLLGLRTAVTDWAEKLGGYKTRQTR